ncbi:D-glycero-alpha-D-manno-heptose 1-phosphate guanylyltransferase [Lysinibacillus composti]|uniref:D-glycero-D-manno-heptose 1-phosphate guanosyltransferase n=1 Tax=Lysinibacillus composti TaxID=720633 RepID=A0A3N9UHH6_9BACI|nr:nucleotidyltransferase family protein [Lysinibacillus composti]MBM7609068.1 D-glycero-alpha-D-manno-heptose 1-phosphate guanylyltransferase [Lysinibacillus composti]RQW75511.1 D-glycero-D-manno-heptose 1-phosphate guanosyltransferase [Lysinibacillus composti]
MEAIILAGGFGTRLRSVVSDVPKPMAPVADKPFLNYLFEYLSKFQITSVVLCTGYKHEIIEQYFSNTFKEISIKYSVEDEPLGTGGAIKKAFDLIESDSAIILNGDTLFNVDLSQLIAAHEKNNAEISIALKHLTNYDRYGSVLLENNQVVGFEEKQFKNEGYINGGVYIINKAVFEKFDLPKTFSFEKEVLETKHSKLNVHGYQSSAYFIDIGIPGDYEKAQKEVKELFQ